MADEKKEYPQFDSLTTNNHLQILKLLIPYMKHPIQKYLAIYIKVQELLYTISFFQQPVADKIPYDSKDGILSFAKDFAEKIKPFCTEEELGFIQQIESMLQAFEMLKTYQALSELLPQNPPEKNNPSFGDNEINPLNILQGFMDDEQRNMFETFMNTMGKEKSA